MMKSKLIFFLLIVSNCISPQGWIPQTANNSNQLLSVFFIDQNTGWAVGSGGTIIKTTDRGLNWNNQISNSTNLLRSVYFTNQNFGYIVGDWGNILTTEDSGINWTSQPTSAVLLYSIYFANENVGWAVGNFGDIFKTTNGGNNWLKQTNNYLGFDLYSVYFINTNDGWCVGEDGIIMHTSNGGNTWENQVLGSPGDWLYSIHFVDQNNGWTVGNNGRIFKTTNGGTSWITQSSGTLYNLFSVFFSDLDNGWAVGDNGTILKTTNAGASWVIQTSGTTSPLWSVYFTDLITGWTVGNGGTILRYSDPQPALQIVSPNGGENWTSGSEQDIKWTSNNVSIGKIEYTTDNGFDWLIVADSVLGLSNNYMWTLPNSPSSECKVRISDVDNFSVQDVSDNLFSISGINITAPNGGEIWQIGSFEDITWLSVNVANVKIDYSTDNGNSWINIISSTSASAGSYYWKVPNSPSIECKVKISDVTNLSVNDTSDNLFIIPPFEQFTEQTQIILKKVDYGSVDWGDYDNDNDLDILLTGRDASSNGFTEIYRNDGNNIYTPINLNVEDVYHSSAKWGDYDNDGDLDFAICGLYVSTRVTKIYKNNGSNTFQLAASLLGVERGSIDWGDYDNDGDLDLLLTGEAGSTPSSYITLIYRNDQGNFIELDPGISGVYLGEAKWCDIDNDKDLDIFLRGTDNQTVYSTFYINNNGTFTDNQSGLIPVYYGSSDIGDFNSDGLLDIVVNGTTGPGYNTSVYYNTGSGFSQLTNLSLPNIYQSNVACGDYDNDGDLDFIISGSTGGTSPALFLYENIDTTFIQVNSGIIAVENGSSKWGDYDNDGDLDLLVTGWNDAQGVVAKVYRNNNPIPNTIPSAPLNLSSAIEGQSVALGWNKSTDNETPQDGLTYNLRIGTTSGGSEIMSPMADPITGQRSIVALGNTNHNNSWTIEGLAPGTYYWSVQATDNNFAGSNFATEQSFTIEPALGITVTSPQAGEIWIGSSKQVVRWEPPAVSGNINIWFSNDGGNTFPTPLSINTLNDGNDTVTVPYIQSDLCRIKIIAIDDTSIHGVNPGNFRIIPQFTELPTTGIDQANSSHAAWGDYDNDGDLDFFLAGNISALGTYDSKIYRNNGNNSFVKQAFISFSGVYAGNHQWGDYDNDGDLDIVLSGVLPSGTPVTKIYKNQGNNQFVEQSDIVLPGVQDGSVNWGDYDNDGDLDLFIAGHISTGTGKIADIYRNDGNNIFTYNFALWDAEQVDASWGDYDNDGDLDIIIIGMDNTPNSRIYRNDGNDLFTHQSLINLFGVASGNAKWGDYDSDGDLDLIISGYLNTTLYKNNGDGNFIDITQANLDDLNYSSVEWGDFDNDGDLDILISGWKSASEWLTKIYRNEGNDNFTDLSTIPFTGITSGSAIWGDYDADGDLDVLITGGIVSSPSTGVTKIYRNNNIVLNSLPTSPANTNSIVNADSVVLSWDKSTDNETPENGLTYNLRIGTTPGGSEIMSPMADTSGQRKIVAMGNANLNNSWTIKGLADGPYYWSVQAIDNNFAGSSFSAEKMFTVGLQSVSIITPNGSEQWLVGSEQNISWSSSNVVNIKLEYTTDNGSNWIEIASSILAASESYAWTIPNTPSTNCKIRVSDANNPGVFDLSDGSFTIKGIPVITIIRPNGGENWAAGSLESITWTIENIQDVKLEYTTNDGLDWLTIIPSVPANTGNYVWTIPDLPSSQCRVKVSDITDSNIYDVSDNAFTIRRIPIISITSPNGSENWQAGSLHDITWTDNIDENVKIDLYKTGIFLANITNSTTSNGLFNWTIPSDQSIGADFRIKISSINSDTVFDFSDSDFTISPMITVTLLSPNGGESWISGSTQNIGWTSVNVSNVKLEYTTNNGSSWSDIIASTPASPGSYNWTVPNTPSTQCKIRISDATNLLVQDVSDNVFQIFNYPTSINVSRTVTFGESSNNLNYRILSIPGNNSASVSTYLTGEHPYDWNAYWDNGEADNYQIQYNGTSTFNITPGKAFWVLSKNAFNVSTQASTVALSGDYYYSIPLHSGWNLISNPFEKSTIWSEVQSINGLSQNQILYSWNSSWSNPTEMKPYEGYYFNNTGNVTTLKLPYNPNGTLGKSTLAKGDITNSLPIDVSDMLTLQVNESKVFVGINPESEEGFDEYDYFSPPSDFEKTRLSLVRDELSKRDRNLFIEQRPEIGNGQEFELEIKAIENEIIKLRIAGIVNFADYEIYLLDKRLSNLYNLKDKQEIELVFAHQINEMKLYIGTQEYIDELKSKLTPLEYGLDQNYPNPFNPATVLRFAIPEKSKVTLQVYNVLGELVQTVINDIEYNSGKYEVKFDGSGLSSGVYIYRLQAGSFVSSKKMMMVK